jgi:hypothetical protein
MKVISRQEALARGLTHFYTGKPCIRGHDAKRYASNKRCVTCANEHYGKGTGRPRQDARAAGLKFYAGRACPQDHPRKRYTATGVCFHCAREAVDIRVSRMKAAKPVWFNGQHTAAIRRLRTIADTMSEATGEPWELDHIIPIRGRNVCGLHIAENLQVVPRSVNRRKSNRFEAQEVAA